MVRAIYKALSDLKSGRVCYLLSGRDHVASVDLIGVFDLRLVDLEQHNNKWAERNDELDRRIEELE